MSKDGRQTDGAPISTGSPGLDYILAGGYALKRIHLIEGTPGAGKTTLGLQFLLEGRAQGDTCLYITLSESREELFHVASTHGWSLDGIEIFELVPPELSLDQDREQSIVTRSGTGMSRGDRDPRGGRETTIAIGLSVATTYR